MNAMIAVLVMWTPYSNPQNVLPFISLEQCEQAKAVYQVAEVERQFQKRIYYCIDGVVAGFYKEKEPQRKVTQ